MISPEFLQERSEEEVPLYLAVTLIAAATDYLSRKTGWWFGEPRGFTDYLTGDGGRNLWLRGDPTGAAVTEASGPGADTEAVTDFVVRETRLVRNWPGVWFAGWEYAVTYTTGFALNEGPASVQEAVIQLALALFQETGREAGVGVTSERLGDYSYQLAGGSGIDSVAQRVPLVLDVIRTWWRPAI